MFNVMHEVKIRILSTKNRLYCISNDDTCNNLMQASAAISRNKLLTKCQGEIEGNLTEHNFLQTLKS